MFGNELSTPKSKQFITTTMLPRLNWLTWIFVLGTLLSSTAHSIQFLGRSFELGEWQKFQSEVDCWTNQGQWTPHPEWGLQNLSFEILSPCYHHAYGPRSTCQALFYTESLNHHWELLPGKCQRPTLLPFNNISTCQALKKSKGNIMIVGDSMNEFFGISVRNLFARNNPSLTCDPACEKDCREHSQRNKLPCGGNNEVNIELFNIRNDHLSLTTVKVENSELNVHQMPWFPLLGKYNISLLILNRGAHFSESDVLFSELNTTFRALQVQFPNISIIWRNTPYGHDYRRHVGAAPLKEPLHSTDHNFHRMPHHYPQFDEQNQLIRKYVATVFV
jgi:hypothetical protein